MKYRPEIDGLRAFAVLPVILYHAGFSFVSGGFLGVDVFFVISGFLITHILINELEENRFSLLGFYERRARRILPALFFIVLCCVPFAWLWMDPHQYELFSKSLISIDLFVSNIHFWIESDYFADATQEMPLLHTWSLAIEEQFYVFFPPLLWLIWRFRSRHLAFAVVIGAALLSLALSEYASYHHPNAAFFLLPTRAWELCAGAICAFVLSRREVAGNNVLALLGLALIAFAYLVYDRDTRLPSLLSLSPVVGAALIILFARAQTWVGRMLSCRMMVGVGLISYSAYLWHHPLFAFTRIRHIEGLSELGWGMLCLVTLGLAYLTWRFIEQPFRKRGANAMISLRALTVSMVACALVVGAIGAHGMYTQGRSEQWKGMIEPNQLQSYTLLKPDDAATQSLDNNDCRFRIKHFSQAHTQRLKRCYERYGRGIVLLGDSHMRDLSFVLHYSSDEARYPFIVEMTSMCRPFNVEDSGADCGLYPSLHQHFEQYDHFSDVIYAQAGYYFIQNPQGKSIDRMDLRYAPLRYDFKDYSVYIPHMEAVKEYLLPLTKKATVTWMGSRIEPSFTRSALTRLGCDYPLQLRPNQEKMFRNIDAELRRSLKDSPIRFVSQIELLQFDIAHDFMNCEVTYWSDGDHFSPEGERRFAKRITLDAVLGNKSP